MRAFVAGVSILGLFAGLAEASRADDQPSGKAYEPAARKLLDDVISAYQKLSGYTDQGELSFRVKLGDQPRVEQSKRSLSYAPPNKLAMDYGPVRLVSDGKMLTFISTNSKQYAQVAAPKYIDFQAVSRAGIPGNVTALMFLGEAGLPMGVMLDLLGGHDPAKSILDGTDGLKLEADREVEKHAYKPLFIDQTTGPDIRLLVDPENHLVSRIEIVYDIEALNAKLPEGKKISDLSLDWNAGKIQTKVADDAFAFDPPKDFKKFEPGSAPEPARAAATETSPAERLVGKPAPEFEINVMAGEGNTQTLRKGDLAGKVVLLDFWATWCAPCLKELPEVQKMIESYAGSKQDVLVVAVSQDDDPSEPAELRKLVEKTLKDHRIELVSQPLGKVALDPDHKAGNAFEVEFVPTAVLLDREGIVRAVHVGGNFEVQKVLKSEIDALLEGKPTPRLKPESKGQAGSRDKPR